MSKFVQQSRVHLDDKDLMDLFSSTTISERFLLKFAKRRGMILSDDDQRETVVDYLSRQTLSWREICELAEELNEAERDEKPTTCQLDHGEEAVDIAAILESVKSDRVKTNEEVYSIKKLPSGAYDVTVTYTETNCGLSRPFQKQAKNVVLEIDPKKGFLEIQHSSAKRATEVIAAIAKAIEAACKKPTETKLIDLSDVRDAELRTQFFLNLPNKVEGFRLLDTKDIRVDRRLPEIEVVEEAHGDDGAGGKLDENSVETMQAVVRQAAMSGTNLADSKLYQDLRADGYFIYSLHWVGKELDDSDRNVEFSAEFTDSVNFRGYRFDVRKITKPGEDKDTKIGLAELRRKYLRGLEDASYASMSQVKASAAENSKNVA